MRPITRRRFLDLTAKATLGLGAARLLGLLALAAEETAPGIREIDAFVERHPRAGRSRSDAGHRGPQRSRSPSAPTAIPDVKTGAAVAPEDLFEIGSITKSVRRPLPLQLREEGKLDLEQPVREYLPWLRIESALRADHDPSPADPHVGAAQPARASSPSGCPLWTAHPPGEHFHYCNAGLRRSWVCCSTSLDGRPLCASSCAPASSSRWDGRQRSR